MTHSSTEEYPEGRTDEAIVIAIQQGEASLFGVLVERYETKLRNYARRFLFGYHDAEDLVQDVFLKAYKNIKGFQTHRKFSSWIYRIAHNEFVNAIKKKGKEPLPFFDPDTLFPHPVANETADQDVHDHELKAELDACLGLIDAKYREPLVLYYYNEMNYQEIADILRIPVATVGVRLMRGREALRKQYEKLHPAYSPFGS